MNYGGANMKTYAQAVNNTYSEKEKLLILGLTGRTGAGCSTAAKILATKNFEDLDLGYIRRDEYGETDEYKYNIIKQYMEKGGKWTPFDIIEGSCVILSYILTEVCNDVYDCSGLLDYLSHLQNKQEGVNFRIEGFEKLIPEIHGIDYIFKKAQLYPLVNLESLLNSNEKDKIIEYYNFYINELPKYKVRIKNILLKYSCYEEEKGKLQDKPAIKYHLYTYLFQKIGNNIRSSGNPYIEKFDQSVYHNFAERISLFIELIKKKNYVLGQECNRICIDAIRNQYESNYLKDKYRAYYLLSISVEESTRKDRLKNMDSDERTGVDKIEYPNKLKSEEIFYHQNISSCFEMADIHVLNENEENRKMFFLTWQLVKYIALIIHPGLITPTHMERCMQLAFNAKYNSGCLSRQVGAVVTGPDFSVKSVGWNDVPKGQVACNLRDVNEFCKGTKKKCYSEYEKTDEQFEIAMNNINKSLKYDELNGRQFPYCFKDVYNGYTKEKNQVYTRSLHAEENAFLQISKYGGQGVEDGFLFCTASPCELCAKKAYQLGIRKIYFIDPYPGISQKHILTFGESKQNPEMNLFYGAIGEAYIALYRPIMAFKDELELVSGVNCKTIAKEGSLEEKTQPNTKDLHYKVVECNLEFKTREIIESLRTVDFDILNGEFDGFDRSLTWTGSSYDGSEIFNMNGNYKLYETKDKVSPYKYQISFNEKKVAGSNIKYKIKTSVKDETHIMHPYLAHMIKYPTDFLRISVTVPKGHELIHEMINMRYADMDMKNDFIGDEKYEVKETEDKILYILEVPKPNLFYTYSLEWEFVENKIKIKN